MRGTDGELMGAQTASYAYPIAVFLPGTKKPDWGEEEGQGVSMRHACAHPAAAAVAAAAPSLPPPPSVERSRG